MVKTWTVGPDGAGSWSCLIIHQLCDLRKVTQLFHALASSSKVDYKYLLGEVARRAKKDNASQRTIRLNQRKMPRFGHFLTPQTKSNFL